MAQWTVLAILVTVAISYLSAATKEIGTVLPSPKINGSDVILTPQVLGGYDADISDFPYQVSMQYYGQHICGGSIISTKYIITAAHCTNGMSASSINIRAGSTYHASGGQNINVARILQHSSYNPSNQNCDIAILDLASDLTFNDNVQSIGLPEENQQVPVGSNTVVSGWGTLSSGGSVPATLQYVYLRSIGKSDCANRYSGAATVTNNMICTFNQGQDACQGDSGGPLALNGQLIGIVSWGIGCAHANYPGVYTDVARFRSYIRQTTGI